MHEDPFTYFPSSTLLPHRGSVSKRRERETPKRKGRVTGSLFLGGALHHPSRLPAAERVLVGGIPAPLLVLGPWMRWAEKASGRRTMSSEKKHGDEIKRYPHLRDGVLGGPSSNFFFSFSALSSPYLRPISSTLKLTCPLLTRQANLDYQC